MQTRHTPRALTYTYLGKWGDRSSGGSRVVDAEIQHQPAYIVARIQSVRMLGRHDLPRLYERIVSFCERLQFAKSQEELLPIQLAHWNVCLKRGEV